jgi:hypothetical protein
MIVGERTFDDCTNALARAYIECATDMTGEFHAVGAALAGSEEKAIVFQELLDHSVGMFVAVLRPHSALPDEELERRCIGLVGAGEALSAAMVRGKLNDTRAIETFASHIRGSLTITA